MSLDPRQLPTTGSETGPSLPGRTPVSDKGARLSEHVLAEIRELPKRFPPGARSAVMPALDLVQEELGYLTPAAMGQVAEALALDPGYIEGVATFYSLFHLQPIGKHHFYICNNLSCQLRGAEELLDHLKEKTGIREYGRPSADGLISFEPVECLGACEYAPVMRYNHGFHYELTSAKLDTLLTGAESGQLDGRALEPQPRPARTTAPRAAAVPSARSVRKRKAQTADQDG